MADKKPTAAQKRWTKLSNEGDTEATPFKSGSASMITTKEQKDENRKTNRYDTPKERKALPEDHPYKKGYFERSYSQIHAMNADERNVKEAKTNKELGKTYLKPDKYTPEGTKIPSYKKGGKVKKTGLALLHKGEHVIPKNKVKSKVSSKKKTSYKKKV